MAAPVLFDNFHFRSAERFLDALSPQKWTADWIFRGQPDASFSLSPSLWRPNARARLGKLRSKYHDQAVAAIRRLDVGSHGIIPPPGTPRYERFLDKVKDVMAEIVSVNEFTQIADELGLHIRESAHDHMGNLFDIFERECSQIYFSGINTYPGYAQALAQHHGIPTRLLDWTLSPRKAAFFAAESVSKSSSKAKQIAVYAFDKRCLSLNCGVRLRTVPREQFAYLHAQDGVFLYVPYVHGTMKDDWRADNDWPDIAMSLWRNGAYGATKPLRRYTLLVAHADKLLELLERERITTAHLMPTYDSIKELLFTRWARL